jgi:transcriptional regulator with XRE-family HTH domain
MDIKNLIQKSGKSRTQIVAESGVSQSYLSLIERGHRNVGPMHVSMLAKSLGVTVADLRPDWVALVSPKSGLTPQVSS